MSNLGKLSKNLANRMDLNETNFKEDKSCDRRNWNDFTTVEKRNNELLGVKCSQATFEMPSISLLFTGLISVLGGGFHFGCQISYINPLNDILQEFIIESFERHYNVEFSELSIRIIWSSIAGILFIGAIIGAAIMPRILVFANTRYSFIFISSVMVINLTAAAISHHLKSAELFIIARLLIGICIGMGTTLQGVFLMEISPVSCRGFIGMLTGLLTNIGYVLASILGLPLLFGTSTMWSLIFYIEIIPCVLLIIHAIFIMHESPIYYLKKGDRKSAQKSINAYYRGCQMNAKTIEELRMELELSSASSKWSFVFNDRATRKALYLSVILNIIVSFSGIIALSFFGTYLLNKIGFSQNGAALANSLAALAGTVATLISSIAIEKIGRRLLTLVSLFGLLLINCGLMIVSWMFFKFSISWLSYLFLSLLIFLVFFFSIGIGPVAWFIGNELAEPLCRAKIHSISICAQYATCFLSPIIYLPLHKFSVSLSFLLFIIPLAFALIFFYLFLPETQNLSSHEIRNHLLSDNRFRDVKIVHLSNAQANQFTFE